MHTANRGKSFPLVSWVERAQAEIGTVLTKEMGCVTLEEVVASHRIV